MVGRPLKLVLAVAIVGAPVPLARGQDLTPRAYLVTPLRGGAVTLSYAFNDGSLLFEGAVPIKDASARLSVPVFTLYHSLDFFGRSANVTASLPYGVGTFRGTVLGEPESIYRSGMLDTVLRFSVNLHGGPAMTLQEMRAWRPRTLLGASLKVVAPTGQYDPTKLINLGSNRWTFKPEVGYLRRFGHFELDAYAGVWFFTPNGDYFSRNAFVQGTHRQTQKPVAAFEAHLSYDVRPRLWFSLDANYWHGGRTSVVGLEIRITLQQCSRVGFTASVPLGRRQSLKLGYADGAYVRFGGDYRIVSAAWQYAWVAGSGR